MTVMSGISTRSVLALIAGMCLLSWAGAEAAGKANQKHFSMDVRATGAQSVHRHRVIGDDALLRRASDQASLSQNGADGNDALREKIKEEESAESGVSEHEEDLREDNVHHGPDNRAFSVIEKEAENSSDADDARDDEAERNAESQKEDGDSRTTIAGMHDVGDADDADVPPHVKIESNTVADKSDEEQANEDQQDLDNTEKHHASDVINASDEDSASSSSSSTGDSDNSDSSPDDSGSGGKIIASMQERRQCPLWQNMGCFLDAIEKACEPDEGSPSNLIKKHTVESAWMCCCPNPYKPCAKSKRVRSCDKAMNMHVVEHMERDDIKPQTLITALQKVRGDLREAGGSSCKVLAPMEPISTCGYAHKPKVKRSIGRANLFCEMLSWQMEELSDGNEQEFTTNSCPYTEEHRAAEGDARKGGRLSNAQIA